MVDVDPSLRLWGWFFLALYIGAMMIFGFIGMRRVRDSDDFATARGAYGPIFLAFALTATTASGGTFIGIPALAYRTGFPALWYAFVYPLGTYLGVLVCFRAVRRAGATFGNRSMPEYLGDRYQSDALRICVALFSLLLLFYLAGQLLSGAVLFNKMMGISILPALIITGVVLMLYIVIGGAHADILTDGVQGALMLLLAVGVAVMFLTGFGVDGGYGGMIRELEALDPALTARLSPTHPVLDSWWDVFAIFVMHAPLGLLPHTGNKLWALKHNRDQLRFITVAFAFGMTLPCLALGGILARAVLGDALLLEGASENDAIPALFVATLPTWLAALIGAGVLAAVMSTADGLMVSTLADLCQRYLPPQHRAAPAGETGRRSRRSHVAHDQPCRHRLDHVGRALAGVGNPAHERGVADCHRCGRHAGGDLRPPVCRHLLAAYDQGGRAVGLHRRRRGVHFAENGNLERRMVCRQRARRPLGLVGGTRPQPICLLDAWRRRLGSGIDRVIVEHTRAGSGTSATGVR